MPRTTYPNLRTTVFEIIEHRGILPKHFAERCGISYDYLYKIRTGERPIPQRFIDSALTILDMPYSALFFEAPSHSGDEVSHDEGSAA